MIEGLGDLLKGCGHYGLEELRDAVRNILGASTLGCVIEQQELTALAPRAFRIRILADGTVRSFVVKHFDPVIAWRNRLVVTRWLPDVDLAQGGPRLLGTAAEHNGRCVWHIYEDLGDQVLDPRHPDRESVEAAVRLIADLHARFADHALLPECRMYGGDLGPHFYVSSVRDAINSLELVKSPRVELTPNDLALCDRLLDRLHTLWDQQVWRGRALVELGGPETLLHGDLWHTNIFVMSTRRGKQARLIDWDHAAVGPVTYDLSTFLLRFPSKHRIWIAELYRHAMTENRRHLPGVADLNLVFETAEYARYANCLIWPAVALVRERAEWSIRTLADIDSWFENWRPVFPEGERSAATT